jgi:cardiolipin synthase
VKLLIQPGDGITALVRGIEKARKSVEVVIFRFDRTELERAMVNAAKRGVFVHALIAYTNRGGEKILRKLEMRFLSHGITVARTADDLVRYHGKMMIVDRKELYLLSFNLTHLDIEHSRSFGVVTRNRQLVQEAGKLFDSDTRRQSYESGCPNFLVSPVNARKQLTAFIRGAKQELLIYDLKISDRTMIRLLEERAKAGVRVRVIGKLTRKNSKVEVKKLQGIRLHARVIIRDRKHAFMGSQSLRELELDGRREIGILFRDPKVISKMADVFDQDWKKGAVATLGAADTTTAAPAKAAKHVARSIAKKIPPVAPIMEQALAEAGKGNADADLDFKKVELTVKEAVKDAVKEAVQGIVEDAVEESRA